MQSKKNNQIKDVLGIRINPKLTKEDWRDFYSTLRGFLRRVYWRQNGIFLRDNSGNNNSYSDYSI